MELESEDQKRQSIPSISGVSQKLDGSREKCSKERSPGHDSFSVKNAVQSNHVTNGVSTPEPKIDTVQIVSHLTCNNMPEGILTEISEPMTKVINLNTNISSSNLPVMKAERQSPLQKNSISSKANDKGFSHITKEEVKKQDLVSVTDSDDDDTHRISKNSKTLGKTRVNPKLPECNQDCIQDACKMLIPFYERPEASDAAMPESVTSATKVTVQEVFEALDLSLPKKKVRDNREKCKWVLDSGYEGSLLMEVDEIEDDIQQTEMEQDEDDEECWFPLRRHHKNNYCDQHSVSQTTTPSPQHTSFSPLDPKDTLLIDDQGIPYTLTPDGHKVPQIDLSEMPVGASEEIKAGFMQFEDDEPVDTQDAEHAQELLPADPPLADSSPGLSQDTLTVENMSPQNSTDEPKSGTLPTISSLPSLPIQIMASNTGSNTPILLLPQSQLQSLSSSTTTNANPGVMALSLPLTLAQDTQSSPVFLLLSSPQVSCENQSSALSTQLSQISSTSSVALPSATSSLGLNPEPVSCATTTRDLSGQNKPCNISSAPTSPCASSSTSSITSKSPAKLIKTETCSDTPTSFQEALLRLAVSAVQKAENHPKATEAQSVDIPSTCSEEAQPGLPAVNHAPGEHCKTEQVVSQGSEPASIEVDQADCLQSPESSDGIPPPSSSSPLHSMSPIFPTNHPKNQDSQALGPRRILYCQYCPRVFYYLSDLERHSITHSQSKPHVCQLCGKAFKRSSHLERHKHIHTGQRNFVCQLCPRRFREAAELTRHQRVHTGEKPYQCLLCHMRFAERNTLRRHTKRKHQGQQQEAMSMKVKQETAGASLLGIQGQQEENAEWYSSTMTEMDSDNDTGGE